MISAITPSIRPELLPMVAKCLLRQTYDDFEWIIGSRPELRIPIDRQIGKEINYIFVEEPPKREGDYYNLDKCWNKMFSIAKGELFLSVVDGLWFPPDTLERFWNHFVRNPLAIVSAIGHQYGKVENNKPETMVWSDPRARTDIGSFYEVAPTEIELCVASLPRQAIFDCGGLDEEYDKGAACGEKEMCWRMDKLGYKFFLDQTIEYRAIQHSRISAEWDERYKIASALYVKHMNEIRNGTRRLNVGFVKTSKNDCV